MWLNSFLLASVPTGLFSVRGFRTCRSGLETGRPVTLIPSESTQHNNIHKTYGTHEHSGQRPEKQRERSLSSVTYVRRGRYYTAIIPQTQRTWTSLKRFALHPSLHTPFYLSVHLFVWRLALEIKIRIHNVTVWNMMRWKTLIINKVMECVCRSGSLEHTQVDIFYLSSAYA